MQWIMDIVGRTGSAEDQFLVGSDKWMGSSRTPIAPSGSFKKPETPQAAVQSPTSLPNPYVLHSQPSAPSNDEFISAKSLPKVPPKQGLYPTVYDGSKPAEESTSGRTEVEEEEIVTAAQVLVTIPGAIVHLINDEESVHLATGDFSLVRLFQERTKLVVIAKIGEDLKWPLVQEETTVKLDPTHYYFTLKVPKGMADDSSSKGHGKSLESDGTEMDTLNYGVTFPALLGGDQSAGIRQLDYYLERYSTFSNPTVVQGGGQHTNKDWGTGDKVPAPGDPSFPGTVLTASALSGDGQVVANEETSAAFWTTIAPDVNDYNSKPAKNIAVGAGHIIRGIFWVSDSAEKSIGSGHLYMKSKFKPKAAKSKVNSVTLGSVRSVRRLSGMTDKVAKGVLGGILYTTGFISSAAINSPPGKAFFKLMPGEVALVSLDAFGRIFDAIELAGTNVAVKSSVVTQDFVDYRYGEEAKELTEESLKAAGHTASLFWTLTKIRKALNPSKAKISKTGIAKSLAKQVAAGNAGKKT